MSDDYLSIPHGWTRPTLSELGAWGSGGTPSRKDPHAYGQGIPWLKIGDLADGPVLSAQEEITEHGLSHSSAKRLPENTLLIAMYGSIGKLGLTRFPCATNQAIAFCKPNKQVDLRYLFYALMRERQALTKFGQGGTQSNISQTILKRHRIPVAPTQQQPQIASKIDELFSQIDEGEHALKRVQTLVERYRQSVLKAAVTGELTRDWRARQENQSAESGEALLQRILKARRAAWEKAELAKMTAKGKTPANDAWKKKYNEPAAPKTDSLPSLPPNWIWASVEQLTTRITSGSRDWKRFYDCGDSVFIMAQNVRLGSLDLSHIQNVDPPEGDRDAERSAVHEHDLLVTIVGANTGDVCRVPKPLEKHYVCQSVALARPALSAISNFLETYLIAVDGGQAQFAEYIYGAGRPHLSFEQLRETCIPIPPLAEQALIDDILTSKKIEIESIRCALKSALTQSIGLRQSVLRSAFSGQLIESSATYESVSDLFECAVTERTES